MMRASEGGAAVAEWLGPMPVSGGQAPEYETAQ